MNKERLLELADVIENDTLPGVIFDMRCWCRDARYTRDHAYECGAVCCIGGYAEQLWPHALGARGALGLDCETAKYLFFADLDSPIWNATRAQAAAVIRNLVATGRVDWDAVMNRAGA